MMHFFSAIKPIHIKYALAIILIIILATLLWKSTSEKQGFQLSAAVTGSNTSTTGLSSETTTTSSAISTTASTTTTAGVATSPTDTLSVPTDTVSDLNLEAVGTKITGSIQPMSGSAELDKQVTGGLIDTVPNINPVPTTTQTTVSTSPGSLLQGSAVEVVPNTTMQNAVVSPILESSTTQQVVAPVPTEPELFTFKFTDLSQSASLYRGV